jgi:hypothetical protein
VPRKTSHRGTAPSQQTLAPPSTDGKQTLDLRLDDLIGPPPAPEQVTTRWERARSTLFHHGDTVATSRPPSGELPLKQVPNLHRRSKIHHSPTYPWSIFL